MKNFNYYFKELKSHELSEITEHSHRPALKDLLDKIAKDVNNNIKILHEGKREGKFGAPDFKITSNDSIIGYIENKRIGENLDNILKSHQIKKYKALSNNIILTNYLEWIWIKDGEILKRETLCCLSDIERKKAKLDKSKINVVKDLIENFFSVPPKGIGEAKKLAKVLAVRAKMLKDFLNNELIRQKEDDEESKLIGLYRTFKTYVFAELSIEEFSDTFSQNLIFGLFLAKLNAGSNLVTLYNAKKFIPTSFELIKELVDFLDELDNEEYKETRWIVEEVLTVMNNLDILEITKSLSYKKESKVKEYKADDFSFKDPYVYFYEDFLIAYDKKLRKSKGVYYTPPPVVNFIVRSLEYILQDKFKIKDGFSARKKVTALDFATGTGTFILEIFKQILDKLPKSSGKRDLIIREHILKNFFGFEYLIAPYTIAHLRLSQYLKDKGYELEGKERFQIYLTNSLEPIDKQIKIPLLPALSNETKEAQKVKDQPILVITGNPPYSKKSKNNGEWIVNLVEKYKYVDGEHFRERQNWLRDDYVKFIRFAQWKMDQVKQGIVGIITNHTFLDNITFRGMRYSLLNSFDQLYFLDLHGSAKKEEIPPNGEKNENVFDIEQGVSVSFLIKNERLPKKVYYSELWGSRIEKYRQCLKEGFDTIKWTEINPISPYYFFYPRTEKNKETYDNFWSITKIFKVYSLPLMTGNDKVTVHFDLESLERNLNLFQSKSIKEIKEIFNIDKDKSNWTIAKAKKEVISTKANKKNIKQIQYRLFDRRLTYFTGNSSGFHSRPGTVSKHMLNKNIGLLIPRQISKSKFKHVFCTDIIPEMCTISTATKEQNQLFPLYLYEIKDPIFSSPEEPEKFIKTKNFTKDFQKYIKNLYKKKYEPKDIIGYIYAILHSQTYREKYIEFLKIDFPRIPFTKSRKDFEMLSEKGWELIQAHLINEIPDYDLGTYKGKGDNEVIKPTYKITKKYSRLYINKTQYFDEVPENVWNFEIGGYQVLNKYFKYRKGRTLTLEEIENVENIVNILAFTFEQMEKIDELTTEWV